MIFRSDRDGDKELYRAASDGSGPQRLTTSPGFDGEPAFAPDGSFAFRTRSAWKRRDLPVGPGSAARAADE